MDLAPDKTVREIISRLSGPSRGSIKVEGTWGSFARLLAAYISEQTERPILYVCAHIEDADKAGDDLRTFGCGTVEALGAWEGEEDLADATDEIRAERLRVVSGIAGLGGVKVGSRLVVPASVQALCQPVPKPESLKAGRLDMAVDKEISPESVCEWLVDNGFERVEGIDLPGQFARRGGIVDIYAPLISGETAGDFSQGAGAVRVEFFGDTVESIRSINLDTLRSSGQLRGVSIISGICGAAEGQRELFVNILPDDTIVILEEPGIIDEVAQAYLSRVEDASRLYDRAALYEAMGRFRQLCVHRFAAEAGDYLKVDIKSVQQYQHKATSVWAGHKAALEELVAEAKKGMCVQLYCEAEAEIKRLGEIITEINGRIPANFKLLLGYVNQGFVVTFLKTIVISHHELFGQFSLRRRRRSVRASSPVDTLSDLHEGDYVVHASYGIGKFLGVETIEAEGVAGEYLSIQYADGVTKQVSVRNIGLVQKFIGTSPKRPKLSKVGSKRWQRQKEKVAASVADLAAELLKVQAERQAAGGIEFGPDSNWQAEFEESFAYQETPDQTIAAGEIMGDMCRAIAMDRLLCGDVGYGKTELAMRAAFKAVEGGKQVAVLVPTTVLCVQHGRTFAERFADFPVTIEVLNRFRTAKEAADVVARAKKGRVDILIGTHRLLSGDVGFKDLGLLIIDEEQRFGVEHKERLKRMRVNVDVLTMTATPIPRTLHMSLLGLRDISSLATPPLDRRSIVTSVTQYRPELIKQAIGRELNRQGQVFFLHNRVRSIERKAFELQKLVPDARFAIAHGQMTKRELEKAMVAFVTGGIDVLVCTTIIESGLDIPNANTIIINDADRFGLAELHQLRGRVGRYKHKAYAYMLLPASRSITPVAARRLKAIEEYSHLGAGFRIALRDLEIRGAGNILGAEQSGHIQTVGYQMYCELLAEAVRRLKGEPSESAPSAMIDLGVAAAIPKDYIPLSRHRMDVYRKIAVARSDEDLEQIKGELADVYGPLPEEAALLLECSELRINASRQRIKSIVASGGDLIFSFESEAAEKVRELLSKTAGTPRFAESDTAYLRLDKNYFEPRTLITVLRKMFNR
ncbi:MAG: transcription-repair coupling factor [Sedimentisphaerales bacterium]|nr:transcription-repair coupling factor [Sedimentisphaerales bacterium]